MIVNKQLLHHKKISWVLDSLLIDPSVGSNNHLVCLCVCVLPLDLRDYFNGQNGM